MKKLIVASILLSLLVGCAGSLAQQIMCEYFPKDPETYRAAGFESYDQVSLFLPNYLYFAFNLSEEEWRDFYKKFPEYWVDVQESQKRAFFNGFNSGYTAYAFRWTTLNKKKQWSPSIIERLDRGEVEAGDDLFKITYALGAPERVVWKNTHEILAYKKGPTFLIKEGRLAKVASCKDCCDEISDDEKLRASIPSVVMGYVMTDNEVISKCGF